MYTIELTLVQLAKRLQNSFRMLLRKLSHLSSVVPISAHVMNLGKSSLFSKQFLQYLCIELNYVVKKIHKIMH